MATPVFRHAVVEFFTEIFTMHMQMNITIAVRKKFIIPVLQPAVMES
jgi:hypothetical protein